MLSPMYWVGVLISWAMPAASWPMALMRWAWFNSRSMRCFSRSSRRWSSAADREGEDVDEGAFGVFDDVIADAGLHGGHGNSFIAGSGDHDGGRQRSARRMARITSSPLRPGMV